MTVKSVGAIFLFIFVYLLLMCSAIALTIGCGILGYTLVAYSFSGYAILAALALLSIGLLSLVFLIKFIFKKHSTDLTHLIEIRKEHEPQLFQMVEELVKEVGTDFPKKIYLSADVNAAVFYDSGFWSMLLPVRKNLQIGLGLVNAVSVIELRAILAHEFGHFSQKTMKVGSYVYNMNRVIYNMLYDNDAYETLIEKWASSNNFLAIAVLISVRIVRGIQWILKKVYRILNVSYMGLSREMEFHADEIAANVTGPGPLKSSLLRLEFAAGAYQIVLNYYQGKVDESKKAANVYLQQASVMDFVARRDGLHFEHGLPQVSMDYLQRHNRSKLVIADQWASHPTTEDRILRLSQLNIPVQNEDKRSAWSIFKDKEHLQHQLTANEFSLVQYPSPATEITAEEFIRDYVEMQREFQFDNLFNGYYDNKSPERISLQELGRISPEKTKNIDLLFGKNAVQNIDDYLWLDRDIQVLSAIMEGHYAVKTFDYDGIKYTAGACAGLIAELELKRNQLKEQITENDTDIYQYFLQKENETARSGELNHLYVSYFDWDDAADEHFQIYTSVTNAAAFMFETTPENQIAENIQALRSVELTFKASVKALIDKAFVKEITDADMGRNFELYLADQYSYFHDRQYNADEINILFTCINNYHNLIGKIHFNRKKKLLDYQAQLAKDAVPLKDHQDLIIQPSITNAFNAAILPSLNSQTSQ
ncbi:M48 family metallopeptidase [Dyadobacter sandarakinus]|uniref:M48 family metalloprotease n=1 Tax=Dyadobacter sandarakinus TaxID=2747268 RepID=A0ABX7I1Z0_9BACT|nr:M48 family metallopeptidase [Dyadobacter sandarakinus]QRQ99833.1 M48 family metalloprotease [Dyadobacter sandarakinus]